jgi:uncharacterized protein YecE (DUF72 family)
VSPPDDPQGTLFAVPPPQLTAMAPSEAQRALGAALPAGIRLGSMSWAYAGWVGLVYADNVSERQQSAHGLTAYASLPWLRCVEIDRSYYEPLAAPAYRKYGEQVPADFRFLVKAHEDCVVARFPKHARYGKRRGTENPRSLDPAYAARVIAAMAEGLGDTLGAALFQFPPQDTSDPRRFAERLHTFLRGLPQGIPVAVELRNRALFTADYGAVLADTGAVHCHNAWSAMPSVLDQARALPAATRKNLIVRWLLKPGDDYAEAEQRCAPYHRIVAADPGRRGEIAQLVVKAHQHGVPALVLIDNKAEGSAPWSAELLGAEIVARLGLR